MSQAYSVVNRRIQMSERARQIAYWQEAIAKSDDLKKINASIDRLKESYKRGDLSKVIKEVQKQMDFSDYGLVAIENILDSGMIIKKNTEFSPIDSIVLNDHDLFKKVDFGNMKSNFLEVPVLDVHTIGLNTGIAGYDDLKENQKEEVKGVLVKIVKLLPNGKNKILETWSEWCENLVKNHPKSAKLIARIASKTFDEIVTKLLVGMVIIGVSFGSIGIKQEPIASAPIITNVYVTNIHVVEEEHINHYYQVIYTDDDNREQVGYVSKRKYTQVVKSLNEIAEN